MAHDAEPSGGGINAMYLLAVIGLICFLYPPAARVVFGFVPAAASTLSQNITTEAGHVTTDGISVGSVASTFQNDLLPLTDTAGSLVQTETAAALAQTAHAAAAPSVAAASVVAAAAQPFQTAIAEAASATQVPMQVTIPASLALAAAQSRVLAQVTAQPFHVETSTLVPQEVDTTNVVQPQTQTQLQLQLPSMFAPLVTLWNGFVQVSLFVSFMLVMGLAYSVIRLKQVLRDANAAHAAHGAHSADAHDAAHEDHSQVALKWKRITEQSQTDNPSDWRIAILEADIMLDDLLTEQGYHGETMSDKMKQVARGDFNTIDLAWDAHKVRNKVAHEGEALNLEAREVRRVIGLYEQVFKEFKYI